jgi:serine/threonine-protein kinase
MGEVYCATDTTLSRQVAIKVLPDALAADPERLARFDREARTLAALNHPNIAAIYGVERTGTASALVMELVEGPTLADRIAQGALPLEEALPIALQITKGLEAAHEQGIIHRDLKPANIKVRSDGTVKVLDFGLAKALGPETSTAAGGNATLSPTITSPAMMTGVGIILGTAAYMSPEQARGRAVDRRADVWAFGAVLFEMLSGERAFAGEDVSDTLADVMRVEPAWTKLPASIPPALLTFLKGCLRKNAAERVRDIGDVRLALEGGFDTIVPAVSPTATLPSGAGPRPVWRRALALVATLLVAAAAAAVAWYMKPVEPRPVVKVTHLLPSGRNFRGTARPMVTVSPDGRQIVYNATGGLYLRSLDAVGDRLIPGTEGQITYPTFSPDGLSLAFSQDEQIRRISLAGGASVPVVRAIGPMGISWEPDGSILYATRDGIWQVPDTGGEPKRLIESNDTEQYMLPQRLPGGDWLLLTAFRPSALQEGGDVIAFLPPTGERRMLRKGAVSGRYVESGHLLYLSSGVLYAVPFDAKHVAITGGAAPAVEGVRTSVGVTALAHMAVSPTGTLAFVPGASATSSNRLSLATANAAGVVTPIKGPAVGPYARVRATPDGKKLAVDSDDGKEAIVWILDMGGAAAMRRLTFGGRNGYSAWSPDGRRVAFQSDREGDVAIYVQNADGTGAVERLTRPEKGDVHIPESWSRDGKHLSFSATNGKGHTLWILSIDDHKAARFRDLQSTEPFGSVFSPDSKWIAYHARPENTAQNAPSAGVFDEPFPATGARYQAPRVNFDFQPVWSHDGRQLLYLPSTASGQMAAVSFSPAPEVTFGTPSIFPFALAAGQLSNGRRAFDVLPNGSLVSLSTEGESTPGPSSANEIRIVVNWFDELRRLAPLR